MNSNEEILNPWFSMWTRPRATIRYLSTNNPQKSVYLLAALGGICQLLDRGVTKSIGEHFSLSVILLLALIAGPISGVVGLYIVASLLELTGQWLGGSGNREDLRLAMAWGGLPLVVMLLIWGVALGVFGHDNFTEAGPDIEQSISDFVVFMSVLISDLVLGGWTMLLWCKAVGEAQGFSAWKAMANLLLAMIVFLIGLAAIIAGLGVLI